MNPHDISNNNNNNHHHHPDYDHHFQHAQPRSNSDSEGSTKVNTPGSEYYHPQRLVTGTPTPTEHHADGTTKPSEEKDSYFSTIHEGVPIRRSNTNASMRSHLSRQGIYGDMDDTEVDLVRQRTRDTVRSKAGTTYDNTEQIFNGAPDGSEFLDLDPELVTWDGPNDPENPRNWSNSQRWFQTIIVGLYTTVSPFASSVLSPAVPDVSKDLGITNPVLQSFTVSIYLIAWVICPLFLAPISETFGRKPVLNIAICLLTLFNLCCAFVKTPAQMLVLRFLAGCAGSPGPSVAAAVMGDLWSDTERNTPLSIYNLGPTLGPCIAPVVAGFTVQYLDWHWTFYVLAILNGAIAIFGCIFYHETYAPTLLQNRCKRLRKETGNENLHTVFDIMGESFVQRVSTTMTRPLVILVTQPIVFGLGLYMAVVYGLQYLMLVTFPKLFEEHYGFSVSVTGLMYLGMAIGLLLGLVVWTPAMQWVYLKMTRRNGNVAEPEFRIILVAPAALILGAGMIIYGQTAAVKAFWFWPLLGTGLYGFALVSVFTCIINYLIDAAVENFAASTVAAASIFRSSFGATFPLFGAQMYAKLGYDWANTLCGIITFVLGIPFPVIVYFYGQRLRAWTERKIIAKQKPKSTV